MKRYIKESDLRSITAGSFEEKRRATMEAVDAFEKGDAPIKRPLALVATFEHHAVVAAADGRFYRYAMAEGKAVSRNLYEGFSTLNETEVRKDGSSLVEDAAKEVLGGKDATSLIVKMLRM